MTQHHFPSWPGLSRLRDKPGHDGLNVVRSVSFALIPALAAMLVAVPFLVRFTGKAGIFGALIILASLPISLVLNAISSRFQAKSQGALDRLTTLVGEWVKNVRLIRYLSWEEALDCAARLWPVSLTKRQLRSTTISKPTITATPQTKERSVFIMRKNTAIGMLNRRKQR